MSNLSRKLVIGFAMVLVAPCGLSIAAHAAMETNAITTNALTHNAITTNALTHNALTHNALSSNGRSVEDAWLLRPQGVTLPSGVVITLAD